MPTPPEVPESARCAALSGLHHRAEHGGFLTPNLMAAKLETLTIELPHRVSVLPPRPVRAGDSLRASARFVGWRFLVCSDGEAVASAQTLPDGEGGWRLSELHEGPLVPATQQGFAGLLEALEQLLGSGEESNTEATPARRPWAQSETPKAAETEELNVQLLLVPAASSAVLWVRRKDSTEDLVFGLEIPGTLLTYGLIRASPSYSAHSRDSETSVVQAVEFTA
jgi:hypothetical protein